MEVGQERLYQQKYRRIIIGGNVILAVIVLWLIIIAVNVVITRLSPPAIDATRAGNFRLSERTKNLLKTLKSPIHITALYRVERIEDPAEQELAKEQRQRLEDLLRRYAMLSDKITYEVIDPLTDIKAKEKLVRRLVEKYSSESERHKELVKTFSNISAELLSLLEAEKEYIQKLAEKNQNVNRERGIVEIYLRFMKDIKELKYLVSDLNELIGGEDIPRYTDAVEQIKSVCDSVKTDLELAGRYLNRVAKTLKGLEEKDKEYLGSAEQKYKPYIDKLQRLLSMTANLPKLELERLYDAIKPKDARVVIVESEKRAKVLGFDDLWVVSEARMGEKVTYDFNGEAAVSSAILALTSDKKSAVVFIYAGGADPIKPSFVMTKMSEPPYKAAREKLEEANMVVESWNILESDTPPTFDEKVDSIVYVVLPSRPQQQEPGVLTGGYNEKSIEKIKSLIKDGSRVMFLVNFTPPLFSQPYPFTKLLKDELGIDVEPSKLVIKAIKIKDQIIPDNRIIITRYDTHEITSPLQGLPSMFQWAVPIKISEEGKHEDGRDEKEAKESKDNKNNKDGEEDEVQDEKKDREFSYYPLITIRPDMGEYWAEANIPLLLQKAYAKFDEDSDTAMPFSLAVAIEDTKSGFKSVVFGNDIFATDSIANQQQYVLTSKGIGAIVLYPGNLELFANSIFWLNDNRNLIAVGPRRADVPRIRGLSDASLAFWKAFCWVIWPLSILTVGAIVYIKRQK